MKPLLLFSLIPFLFLMDTQAQTAGEFAEIWDNNHITTKFPSDVRHADLKNYLEHLKKLGLKVDEVGRSNANREIYQVEFGTGKTKVFMWSQMHGDEPTATSALMDIFAYMQTHRDKAWVKTIYQNLTIRAVPMLNPDGEELYQRRNLQNIDINRDARDLKTPEARLLKKLRDAWSPDIGFNLHNENERTTVGKTDKQAAISLLVVYGDAAKTTNPGHERNKRLVSAMIEALNNYIPGYIGKYDDEYTATAFGDNFSAWGTPVILIETGSMHGKDEMYLVKMNFIAMLTALTKLADGSEKNVAPTLYEQLPDNSSGRIYNFVFRNLSVVNLGKPESSATAIGVNTERRRASLVAPNRIQEIGTVSRAGLEEYDASGYYVVPRTGKIKVGEVAEFIFYKKDRKVDWASSNLEKQYPPDAIFSAGKWIKGGALFSGK
jgi:Predicted carboxypeptidase